MALSISTSVELGTTGVRVPLLGFGSSHQQGGSSAAAIKEAISLGIRHFDTAQRYGTEGTPITIYKTAPLFFKMAQHLIRDVFCYRIPTPLVPVVPNKTRLESGIPIYVFRF